MYLNTLHDGDIYGSVSVFVQPAVTFILTSLLQLSVVKSPEKAYVYSFIYLFNHLLWCVCVSVSECVCVCVCV